MIISGSRSFGLFLLTNSAKLLYQARAVPISPVFGNLAVGETIDGDPGRRHRPLSWGDTQELPFVSATYRLAGCDLALCGEEVGHCDLKIREGGKIRGYKLFDTLDVSHCGHGRVVRDSL